MSAFFDYTRFCRLMRSHWAENRRSYIWFAAISLIIDFIIVAIMFMADEGRRGWSFRFDSQVVWFTVGFFITGIIFATRYWGLLSHPGACLITLMRPASIFEKWLLALVWMVLIFPVAYTVFYTLLHWPSVHLAQWLYQNTHSLISDKNSTGPDFSFYWPFMMSDADFSGDAAQHKDFRLIEVLVFSIWVSILGFCAGFKVFFRKASTLKMVILAFIIFIFGLAFSAIFDVDFFKFGAYWVGVKMAGWQADTLAETLSLSIVIGIPSLLWIALYFHLQEREV